MGKNVHESHQPTNLIVDELLLISSKLTTNRVFAGKTVFVTGSSRGIGESHTSL